MQNKNEDLIKRAARNLAKSVYAIALTGAGISTESGIPDFRGPSGVWTKNPEAEKRAGQSYQLFQTDPKKWWEERLSTPFKSHRDLDKVMPNPGHYALAKLEQMGILKWVITQNIDDLHRKAGSKNVLDYHGNAFKLRCASCSTRYDQSEFDLEKLKRENQLPPICPKCRGVLKNDGVLFGEPIPSYVAHQSIEEAQKCDVMLICGTSAVVYPFAELPRLARQSKTRKVRQSQNSTNTIEEIPLVTIVKINADPTPLTEYGISDYLIQGKTGEILPQIVKEIKQLKK